MNEIRLSGLLRDRYRTKFFGLVNRFSYPVLGYSSTPCSYPNNLSSRSVRDCSMHSPLRVKIQNAINKALQLEQTDVLFVGGRRRNRKRRKHGKDKKKSKKYEGKETPVLKAKAYSGNNGKYIALLADDDISLSPSMVDDLLDGTSMDCIRVNQEAEDNEKYGETRSVYDDNDLDELDYEVPENDNIETSLKDELEKAQNFVLTNDEERHNSCDTGYNSEEENKSSITSDNLTEETPSDDETKSIERAEVDSINEANINSTEDDDVFFHGTEETVIDDDFSEIAYGMDDISIVKGNKEVSAHIENQLEHRCIEDDQQPTKQTGINIELQMEQLQNAETIQVKEKFPGQFTEQPRITANFDYDEEEEEEIYTKQPKPWFKRKKEEEEELRPLICCGDDNGVGFACCTIL